MTITYLQLAEIVLTEVKKPLTYTEIWNIAKETHGEALVDIKGKTPWQSLGSRLYVDVRDNPNSLFVSTGKDPVRFMLKNQLGKVPTEPPDTQEPQAAKNLPLYLEKDLHALMVYYGFHFLKAYLMTIKHNVSGKKNYGEWVHPDIVGCYYPFADWDEDVVDVSNLLSSSAIKLFSFELKRELNFSNLRESFFQAVSNSSWANEGYLVASEIEAEDNFMSELTRLSTAFGIGIIKLNTEDPDSCSTLLPARTKDGLDWETVNKMAAMNGDFKKFLRRIKIDTTSKEAHKDKYDPVLSKEALVSMYQKK